MRNSESIKNNSADALKMILISLAISLAGVLVLALVIRTASLEDKVITPVLYAIKILSVLLGCLLGFKTPENGVLKGAIGGLIYVLLSFLIFAALSAFKDVAVSWIDLPCLTVAGSVSGAIAVNIRAKIN